MKSRTLRFSDVEIDVQNLRVTVGSGVRALEPKSFRLLLFLVENPGRILSKEEIMGVVWPETSVSENSLTRAIAQIRKALDDDSKAPKYVETVHTMGYRFIGKLSQEPGQPERTPEAALPALASANPVAISASTSAKSPVAVFGICLVMLAAAGVWWALAAHNSGASYLLRVTRVSKLTSYPGDEREPAISPDGSYVAFSWSGPERSGPDGGNYDIYVVQAGGGQPLRLTTDPAPDSYPAWSPDGRQIAFIRQNGGVADLIVVPPLGGPERTIHRFYRIGTDLDFTQHPLLCWSHDGKSIIYSGQTKAGEKYQLFLLSLDTGTVRVITSTAAGVAGDSSPALSGDGKSLAFGRYIAPRNGHIWLQPLTSGMAPQGPPTEVPNSRLGVHSPIWLEDGKQLLFADYTQIFQWSPNKGTSPIYVASGMLGGMSLGPRRPGNTRQIVVASEDVDTDIWSIPLNPAGTEAAGPPQQFLRSTEDDAHPDFSPDGRHIVFTSGRSGSEEAWVSDADGGNPRQLSHLGAHVLSYPKWSPDGARIAFHARVPDIAEVYVVDWNQGVPRQITHENPGLALATWSNDGRFLYASTLVGGTAVTYRFPSDGGPMERLWEGGLVRESVDGKYVLYWKTTTPGIFRRSLIGDLAKNPEELLIPDFWPNNQLGGYAPFADGVYYVSGNARGRPGPFRFFDYGSRKSRDVASAASGLRRGFAISPDRRRLLFAASSGVGGDLLSLELR